MKINIEMSITNVKVKYLVFTVLFFNILILSVTCYRIDKSSSKNDLISNNKDLIITINNTYDISNSNVKQFFPYSNLNNHYIKSNLKLNKSNSINKGNKELIKLIKTHQLQNYFSNSKNNTRSEDINKHHFEYRKDRIGSAINGDDMKKNKTSCSLNCGGPNNNEFKYFNDIINDKVKYDYKNNELIFASENKNGFNQSGNEINQALLDGNHINSHFNNNNSLHNQTISSMNHSNNLISHYNDSLINNNSISYDSTIDNSNNYINNTQNNVSYNNSNSHNNSSKNNNHSYYNHNIHTNSQNNVHTNNNNINNLIDHVSNSKSINNTNVNSNIHNLNNNINTNNSNNNTTNQINNNTILNNNQTPIKIIHNQSNVTPASNTSIINHNYNNNNNDQSNLKPISNQTLTLNKPSNSNHLSNHNINNIPSSNNNNNIAVPPFPCKDLNYQHLNTLEVSPEQCDKINMIYMKIYNKITLNKITYSDSSCEISTCTYNILVKFTDYNTEIIIYTVTNSVLIKLIKLTIASQLSNFRKDYNIKAMDVYELQRFLTAYLYVGLNEALEVVLNEYQYKFYFVLRSSFFDSEVTDKRVNNKEYDNYSNDESDIVDITGDSSFSSVNRIVQSDFINNFKQAILSLQQIDTRILIDWNNIRYISPSEETAIESNTENSESSRKEDSIDIYNSNNNRVISFGSNENNSIQKENIKLINYLRTKDINTNSNTKVHRLSARDRDEANSLTTPIILNNRKYFSVNNYVSDDLRDLNRSRKTLNRDSYKADTNFNYRYYDDKKEIDLEENSEENRFLPFISNKYYDSNDSKFKLSNTNNRYVIVDNSFLSTNFIEKNSSKMGILSKQSRDIIKEIRQDSLYKKFLRKND